MYLITAQIVRVTEAGETICQDVPLFYVEAFDHWAASRKALVLLHSIIKPFDGGQLKSIHIDTPETM